MSKKPSSVAHQAPPVSTCKRSCIPIQTARASTSGSSPKSFFGTTERSTQRVVHKRPENICASRTSRNLPTILKKSQIFHRYAYSFDGCRTDYYIPQAVRTNSWLQHPSHHLATALLLTLTNSDPHSNNVLSSTPSLARLNVFCVLLSPRLYMQREYP